MNWVEVQEDVLDLDNFILVYAEKKDSLHGLAFKPRGDEPEHWYYYGKKSDRDEAFTHIKTTLLYRSTIKG